MSQREILREGLRPHNVREDLKQLRLAEFRNEIAIGNAEADRGEFVGGEDVFSEIRERSAQWKRARI